MIKQWLIKWFDLEPKCEHDAAYFLVNRHYLSSVSLSDLDDVFEGMSEQEKKEYVGEASQVYNNPIFKKEIRYMFGQQALFVAAECENWDQDLIGRGTINGIGLVEDRFKELNSIHQENIKPEEELEDDFEPIPKV